MHQNRPQTLLRRPQLALVYQTRLVRAATSPATHNLNDGKVTGFMPSVPLGIPIVKLLVGRKDRIVVGETTFITQDEKTHLLSPNEQELKRHGSCKHR
jgi:hypothetical protein